MAIVIRENVGILNDKLTVKISKDDYYPSFEKAIKEYSRKANISGFRKGMVPPGMVKKMYGASIFYDEIIKVVEKEIQQYISIEKPDIFAQPLPIANDFRGLDMNNPEDYDFPFEIGLKPAIKTPDFNSVTVTFNKVKVTDGMINEEISRLQDRFGKMTDPETVTSDDAVLNVNFVEVDSEGNPVENGISKDNSLVVKYFTPAYREQLLGKMKEDSIQLQLNEAFEEKEREWLSGDLGIDNQDPSANEKKFKMTITKIGLVEKKELDDEFFNEVFPGKEIKTEDEFRDQVRQQIQRDWDAQSNNQLRDQLYHILLETPVELPEEFLKKWMQKKDEKEKSPEEVEAEFPVFKNQLKWTLITDKIVRDNKIEVSQAELRAYMQREIMQYFGQMQMGSETGWLESYMDKMMKDEKQVESNYGRLLAQKLFAWAQSQVNPVEKEVTAEELTAMQHHH